MTALLRKIVSSLLLLPTCALAQNNLVLSDNIASVQVVAGVDWLSMPVIMLNGEDPINIAFDDLTHEYHRYVYKIEHCEADWSVSEELFQSDYCKGFADGNTIDDVTESINTTVLYTHYQFQIPNDKCQLLLSGNYRVTVYDDNSGDTVLQAFFMVCEPCMGIDLSVTTNTDIDINREHQQVAMQLNYGSIAVRDYKSEIKTVVLQNGNWHNAVFSPTPQYVMRDGLQWKHCHDLIFPAGNEYHKFETLDPTHTTMGLESVDWDGTNYHAYIWPDEPRPSYIYDEDANGSFYIRNSDNVENDYASDYIMVHFTLKAPQQTGDVFINGKWTNEKVDEQYRMEYDAAEECYTKTLPLKQGYYSYQYLMQQSDGQLVPLRSEGIFFQTENEYQALVYYRGTGQRTDRLVAYKVLKME